MVFGMAEYLKSWQEVPAEYQKLYTDCLITGKVLTDLYNGEINDYDLLRRFQRRDRL